MYFRSSGRYSSNSHKSNLRTFGIIFSPAILHVGVDDAGIKENVLLAAMAIKMVLGPARKELSS